MRKMSDKIEKNIVSVDEDILKFLKAAYFGDFSDRYKVACNRAYRDMNRTIRFNGLPIEDREKPKSKVKEKFEEKIKELTHNKISRQDEFNDWHKEVCDQILEIYKEKGITLTYGQAQKWINMTIKYLYVLEPETFDGVFDFLHIPIDKYVLDIAKELGVERIKGAWSKLDDYEEYLKYQENIKEKIGEIAPLRWEFRNWLKAAKNIS